MMLLLLISPLLSLAKGGSGKYFISGIAYNAETKALIDKIITVKFNGRTWTVNTDHEGRFEIEIPWVSACPSGITRAAHQRMNRKLNPKWIEISYESLHAKLENNWQKYARLWGDKEEATCRKDIYFS